MMFMNLFADGVGASMFHLEVAVLEKILRPILVYLFLVLLLRIFGKRELAQLNPFDLVVLLSLSNTVQNAIIGDDTSVTGGLVGAFSLCAINYVVVRFVYHRKRLGRLLQGRSTPLIEDGKINKANMAKELITRNALTTIVHRQGFASIEDVKSCTLEPGGTFAIEAKETQRAMRHQKELLDKLDQVLTRLETLENRLEAQEKSSAKGTP